MVVAATLFPIRRGWLLVNAPMMLEVINDGQAILAREVDSAEVVNADLLVDELGTIFFAELVPQDWKKCLDRLLVATGHHLMNDTGAVLGLVHERLFGHALRNEDRAVSMSVLKKV